MALVIDAASAKIAWRTQGATAGVDVGRQHVLLHCTKNANRSAGDTAPAGRVSTGNAVDIEGTVFVEATGGEFDLGTLEFGMVQISQLAAYRYLYAGRVASEGSTTIDLKAGYSRNPSLDVEPGTGETVDQHIFSPDNLSFSRVATGRKGFNIKVRFGDHPNNAVPLKFENRISGAPNFIARVSRNEAFVTYFVSRERPGAALTILARLGWAVNWDAEFTWTSASAVPAKNLRTALLFPGEPRTGAPNPPDTMSQLALARTEPTTNKMDTDATEAAWNQRREPICVQSRTRPAEIGASFFR